MEQMLNTLMDWIMTPAYDATTVEMWLLGLLLILATAFLWSTVVRDMMAGATEVTSEVAKEIV